MVAVVTPGMNAEMWLPAAHFAAANEHLRWPVQPTFQTTSLVVREGSTTYGR
jgi:hypothetical protein